ncbi:dde superfamily endonuclease [Holotrichia oblita]|uniref:Dde superfamily endonuclease n=1 Tax=Holotrichia oblita TaxID=644536 RepID=A0ACB9SHV0_HOLOL|nr:dde superfamily endonuclease [Holotrichia oblita]
MAAAAGYFAVLINNEIQNEYRRNRVRYINRNLRDSSNPFELPEKNFVKIFRLSKESARSFMCIAFFGHGSYQESVGRGWNFAISEPAVSKCITQVTNAINNELNNWIVFSARQSIQRNKQVFFEQYGFPGIVGAIDCSHVAIVAPPANHHLYPAAAYYNRKGFYSINVQLIVDANLKIINVNARFPGSVHDAAIWRMSNIHKLASGK